MVSVLILGLLQKFFQRSPPRSHGSSRAEMTGAINKHWARASVGPDPLRPYDICRRGRCCTGGAGAGTVIGRGGSRLVSHPPPVGGIGPSRSSASTTTSGQALSWLTDCVWLWLWRIRDWILCFSGVRSDIHLLVSVSSAKKFPNISSVADKMVFGVEVSVDHDSDLACVACEDA